MRGRIYKGVSEKAEDYFNKITEDIGYTRYGNFCLGNADADDISIPIEPVYDITGPRLVGSLRGL